MRFIVKAKLDTAVANEAVRKGKLGSTLQSILDDLKPEAVYFMEEDGRRTAVLVIDMADTSQIPAIAEPFFLAFNAAVTFHPAMAPEDLEKSGPAIGAAVKKYG
jgi:hypothetical protein